MGKYNAQEKLFVLVWLGSLLQWLIVGKLIPDKHLVSQIDGVTIAFFMLWLVVMRVLQAERLISYVLLSVSFGYLSMILSEKITVAQMWIFIIPILQLLIAIQVMLKRRSLYRTKVVNTPSISTG